ncbi:MAG: transglutaminase N-terminal domain-containing protein [Vicinamibacterales bacterium]
MIYRVVHATTYRYEGPVSQCQSEVRLTPRRLPWQTVLSSTIETTPVPAWIGERTDYFGNIVNRFGILERHDRFVTVATSEVRLAPRPPVDDGAAPWAPWEDARHTIATRATAEALQAAEYSFDSPYVTVTPELEQFARPSFDAGRPLIDAVADLSRRIHAEFIYAPATTKIDTPLLETLFSKRGVCQDFSHVMIGALRSLGLAARYVSGYLRSGADTVGAEASHAWVGVYVPGAGWVDFDPTNDVRPDVGHVTIGWGRDYGDVTPIKGVALGGGCHDVSVEVSMVPVPSEERDG